MSSARGPEARGERGERGSADADDALLGALRELPRPALDGAAEVRVRRQAHAAFLRAFDASPWHTRLLGAAARAALPVALAGIVGVYLTWAIATASAFVAH